MDQSIEIFCCAAEADRSFLGQLSTQLALQQQQGIIKLWDESQVPVGARADQEIQRHLTSAHIFLLLISPDFLANDYCYNRVMKAALERHGRGEAITIPVIVRPAIWQDDRILKHIQVLPRNGKPISGQRDQDHALWEVAKEISVAVQMLGEPRVQPDSGLRQGPYGGMSSPQTGSGLKTGGSPTGQPPVMRYQPMPGVGNRFSSSGNERKKTGIILVVMAVIITFGGVTAFALYTKGSSDTVSGNTSYLTTTQVSSTSSVTTPTIAPTASLSSPKLPLTIPCANCPYPQLTVTLNRIAVDSPARSTRWVFSFLNSGSSSCSSLSFYPLRLTDSIGTNYAGKGQVENNFAIDVGQSVQETSIFAVLPTSGTEYTLSMTIYLRGCQPSAGVWNTYQTVNFTFA